MKSINKRKSVISSVLGAIKIRSPSYGLLNHPFSSLFFNVGKLILVTFSERQGLWTCFGRILVSEVKIADY